MKKNKKNLSTLGLITQADLYNILPFGKTKIKQIIKSGNLPLMKVGKDYVTTHSKIEEWIEKNIGKEIYY
jgi:hypothetical protein